MKREEKSALSRKRILDAAMKEFSQKGFHGASLNSVWMEEGFSKGIIYHHFKDKEELYLICVEKCLHTITTYLKEAANTLTGSIQNRLRQYFDARIHFFAENPVCLGIFVDALFSPPEELRPQIAILCQEFNSLNISVLTDLLKMEPLRPGFTVDLIVTDFLIYMDYFNMHFKTACKEAHSKNDVLREHEERCHRQLNILLYGVLDVKKQENI